MSAPDTNRKLPSPAERQLHASLAAHDRWARCEDRTAATAAARQAFVAQFEKLVDPDNKLDPAERARRAESARRAHYARLALKSAQARRARAAGRTTAKGKVA